MVDSAVDMFFKGLLEAFECSVPTPIASKLLRLKDQCKEQEKNNMIGFANDYAYIVCGCPNLLAEIHYYNVIETKHNENL